MNTKSIFDLMFNEDFMNLTVREMCEKFDCSVKQSKGVIKIKFKCPKFRFERNRSLRTPHSFTTCEKESKWTTDSCCSCDSQSSLSDVVKYLNHPSDDNADAIHQMSYGPVYPRPIESRNIVKHMIEV